MTGRIFLSARLILIAVAILSLILMFKEGVNGNYRFYGSIIFLIAAIINVWQGIILYRTNPKTAILIFVLAALLLAVALMPLAII